MWGWGTGRAKGAEEVDVVGNQDHGVRSGWVNGAGAGMDAWMERGNGWSADGASDQGVG